jgi:hypothetical protein
MPGAVASASFAVAICSIAYCAAKVFAAGGRISTAGGDVVIGLYVTNGAAFAGAALAF